MTKCYFLRPAVYILQLEINVTAASWTFLKQKGRANLHKHLQKKKNKKIQTYIGTLYSPL